VFRSAPPQGLDDLGVPAPKSKPPSASDPSAGSLNRTVAGKMIRAGTWAGDDEVRRFRNLC
jgi:hypothetical protein